MRYLPLLFTAALLSSACYNADIVRTVDYSLSLLPQNNEPPLFGERTLFLDEHAAGQKTRVMAVHVTQPRFDKMRAYGEKQWRLEKMPLKLYFFASDRRMPDISKDGLIPQEARPFLAAVYYQAKDNVLFETHPEAFETSARDFGSVEP